MSYIVTADMIFRVIGVDPGLSSTGWGVIECQQNSYRIIEKGAISTSARKDFPSRLLVIHDAISEIIETFTPKIFAIEKAIYAKNVKIALSLGHVRGLLILAAAKKKLAIAEYTPKEIKSSITGNGNASKVQVQKMIQSLFSMPTMPSPDDIADALAVALCHYHRFRSSRLL